ncbi:ATPase [Tanacetum coccineum]
MTDSSRITSSKKSYYGVIEEIWELDYNLFVIPLFKCKWVNDRGGVKVDRDGFMCVNLSTNSYTSDPFIIANQATQARDCLELSLPKILPLWFLLTDPQKELVLHHVVHNFFLTGSKDGELKLWDAKNAKLVYHWPKLHDRHTFIQPSSRGFGGVVRADVTDIQVDSNGFLSCGGDGTVKLGDTRMKGGFAIRVAGSADLYNSHPGGLLFTKFGSSLTTLLDSFQDSYSRLHDKSKETPKTGKQLSRLFPNKVTIQTPQDEALLSDWKQQLDRDTETLKSQSNIVSIRKEGVAIEIGEAVVSLERVS